MKVLRQFPDARVSIVQILKNVMSMNVVKEERKWTNDKVVSIPNHPTYIPFVSNRCIPNDITHTEYR